MTITIELSQEQEAHITALARQRGLSVQELVAQMLTAQIGTDSLATGSTDTATLPGVATADEETQRRLHATLRNLLAHSDALERQPGVPGSDAPAASVAEAIRKKYRRQGLQV